MSFISFHRESPIPANRLWRLRVLAGVSICAGLVYCSGHNTAGLLDASFLASQYQTPQLLAPADEEHVPPEVLLRFSGQAVKVSFLEVATDAAFRNRVFHQPLEPGATTYLFTAPESRTYYWRLNGPRPTAVRSFRSGDGIYASSAVAIGGQGTRISPYKSLQLALNKAKESKLPVFVAGGMYHETINFPAGVYVYDGYHPITWQRDIATQKTVLIAQDRNGHSASAIYVPTLIDGFSFQSQFSDGDVTLLRVVGSSQELTIKNSVFQNDTQSNEQNLIAIQCDYNCRAVIDTNTFYSSYNSTTYAAIFSKSSSAPVIRNNIFVLLPVYPDLSNNLQTGVRLLNSPNTIISNNLFVSLAKGDIRAGVFIDQAQGGIITNNVVYAVKGVSDFSLVNTDNDPNFFVATLENNLYYFYEGLTACNSLFTYRPHASSGTCRIYHHPTHSLSTLHGYTLWTAGTDKARGNYVMPSGSAGQFIRRLPQEALFTLTDGADNQTLTLYIFDDNTNLCSAILANGTYLEWNGDGIARQVTGCTIHEENPFEYHYRYTVNPPLASAAENTASRPVFLWDSYDGSSGYMWDFSFEPKSLAPADWNTLRYGGKDTAGNNCGAPTGGPGMGAGAQTCGYVTLDRLGNGRTVGNGQLAQNNTGVRDGFSIGPQELP